VTIPTGVVAKVSDVVDDLFTVQYLSGTAPVTVDVNGTTTTIATSGAPASFSANVAPAIQAITSPVGPVSLLAQPVAFSATFSDPGTTDTHTCSVTWTEGVTTAGAVAGRVCTASYRYTRAGVYTVTVNVTDNAGESDTRTGTIVVYDPAASVAGSGWFNSPAGAAPANPTLAGRATFAFSAKYNRGATVPTGTTEFQFKAGTLDFRSTEFEWMVVAGSTEARFAGRGTVNGRSGFRFMIWVGDGTPDTFQMRIWSDAGTVYDNGSRQAIGGGSITVRTR
jgi:hypothetical protein